MSSGGLRRAGGMLSGPRVPARIDRLSDCNASSGTGCTRCVTDSNLKHAPISWNVLFQKETASSTSPYDRTTVRSCNSANNQRSVTSRRPRRVNLSPLFQRKFLFPKAALPGRPRAQGADGRSLVIYSDPPRIVIKSVSPEFPTYEYDAGGANILDLVICAARRLQAIR